MTTSKTEADNIQKLCSEVPATIKFQKNDGIYQSKSNETIRNGCFQQYISVEISKNKGYNVKLISENGVKVIKDIKDTIFKETNAMEYFDIDGVTDYSTTIKYNVYLFNNKLISADKYKHLYDCLPKIRKQYINIENMLSGLEFLHNNGFIHECLNLYSYYVSVNESSNNLVEKFIIADIDLCKRWNKNKYFDKLEKKNSNLKNIYEKRLQRNIKNIGFCSLKQHTGSKVGIKDNIESWYYICIYMFENLKKIKENLNNEDLVFLEKQNMRKPSYPGYDNVSTRFTEILYVLDKMNDDNIDYNLIKKKIISASKHPVTDKKNLEDDVLSEPSDYLNLAKDSRLRRVAYNFEDIEKLNKELNHLKIATLSTYDTKVKFGEERSCSERMKTEDSPIVKSLSITLDKVNKNKGKKTISTVSCSKNVTAKLIDDTSKNKTKNNTVDINKKKEAKSSEPPAKKKRPSEKNILTSVKKTFKKFFKK